MSRPCRAGVLGSCVAASRDGGSCCAQPAALLLSAHDASCKQYAHAPWPAAALLLCCRAPKPHFIPVCHQLLPSKPPTPAIGGAAVKGTAVTATPTPMLGASPALGTRPGDKPLDPSVRRTIPASESTPNLVSTTSSTRLVTACMRPDCHTAADLARLGAVAPLQHGSSSLCPCVCCCHIRHTNPGRPRWHGMFAVAGCRRCCSRRSSKRRCRVHPGVP